MKLVTAPDFASLADRLGDEVRRIRTDPLAPITVVVPRETARTEVRDTLFRALGGLFAVDVLAWPAWVDALVADELTARGARRLTEAGFERLAGRVLADTPRERRGPWLETADAPGAARLLAGTLADLLEGGFDPEALAGVAALRRDPWRRELGSFLDRFVAAAIDGNLWDRRRVERRAAELEPAPDGGPTLFFGFHDFAPVQRGIVARRAAVDPVVLFVPGVSPQGAGPGEGALAPLLSWARELGADVEWTGAAAPPAFTIVDDLFASARLVDPGPARVTLRGYATDAAEVRGIAGAILDDVATGARRFGEFLVTIPAAGGPPPLLFRRIFAKAHIPLRDGVGIPASLTRAGRLARLLLRAYAGGRAGRDEDALSFAAPPLDAAGDDVADAAEFFVRARDAREAAERFAGLYRARLGEDPPAEVQDALDAVALALGERTLRLREFSEALAAALDATRVRDDAGDGVLLSTMDAARGLARPVVFHAGLVRGAVRRPPAGDPLLDDGLRRLLNESFGWQGRGVAVAEDRREERLLLARFAFETATEHSLLSFAERDRVGGEIRNPSGMLLDLASARAGRPLTPRSAEFAALCPPRAPSAVRLHPADATDLDTARFAGGAPDPDDVTALLDEDRARHLPRVWRAAEARWGDPRLGPFDGVLADPRALSFVRAGVDTRQWSATALESMANCPFRFLLRLLHLDEPSDEPEDYDPRERGSLFHGIYEAVSRTLQERDLLPLDRSRLAAAIALVDAAIARERSHLAPESAVRRLQRRATLVALRADLVTAFAREAHRDPDRRTVPERFELAFGGDDEEPAAHLDLPDGRRLPLRGKIDRVDRRTDGRLEVVDLKTGAVRSRSGSVRWTHEGKTELRLQLPLYLEAASQVTGARAVRASYWHATADAAFQEIVYDEADLARDRDEIAAIAQHLVQRIREGWFPCTPSATRCCYPGNVAVCGPSVAERFGRKLEDPELIAHLARIRGGAGEEGDA